MSDNAGQIRSIPIVVLAALAACSEETPLSVPSAEPVAAVVPGAPAPLVQVAAHGSQVEFWPFTGRDFVNEADPINLAFVGEADPLQLRAALLSLDGNRTGFGLPFVAPFDCTWSDAIGDNQTAYSTGGGWTGSAVQLACGGYGPVRFHVRFFEAGGITIAGAHFEVLIPGTADHALLSWELAEQLVVIDFLRTGLLDPGIPVVPSPIITPVPTYRAINPLVYNGLPPALVALLGTPPAPAAAPVPIPNDGRMSILLVAEAAQPVADTRDQSFVIQYDQIVPKPFCSAGPADFIHVFGPVTLQQTARLSASGEYTAMTKIAGELDVTPLAPGSATRRAVIDRSSHASILGRNSLVDDWFRQTLLPQTGLSRQSSSTHLRVGPGITAFESDVRCE